MQLMRKLPLLSALRRLVLCVSLLLLGSLALPTVVQVDAQGANLLQNPGMENPYVGQGGAPDQTAPSGWSLWFTGVPVTSYPHVDPAQIHGGGAAWNIRKGGAPFTAGGFQQVTGIHIGSRLHASIFGQSYTCNDQVYSCIGNDGRHHSDVTSGAYIRVGIDPSGGTNPASSQIVWSASTPSFDTWSQIAVDAINCSATVTFFTYTSQSSGMAINAVYFDDAALVITQDGANGAAPTCGAAPGSTPGSGAAPVVPTSPPLAPFVQKQKGLQPDGSIIHTVVAGDTLAAIGVAYGVTLDQLRTLNHIEAGDNFLKLGQKIIVRGPTPPTPTDSATLVPTSGAVVAVPTNIPTSIALAPTSGSVGGGQTVAPFSLKPIITLINNGPWIALGLGLAILKKATS